MEALIRADDCPMKSAKRLVRKAATIASVDSVPRKNTSRTDISAEKSQRRLIKKKLWGPSRPGIISSQPPHANCQPSELFLLGFSIAICYDLLRRMCGHNKEDAVPNESRGT